MEDSSSDSSSVSNFLSLDSSSIYETETCDSLIAGFEQCQLAEKKISSPQDISTQDNSKVIDFSSQSVVLNNHNSNKIIFEKNSTMESLQGSSLNNKHTRKTVVTHEVGVNTDKSFNYKTKNYRQPYYKYKKHLNQYHNFKRSCQIYNGISKKQHKKFNNYKNYNQTYQFNNRWQFRKPQWQEERTERAFYFFTQLMECFNGIF